MPAVHGAETLKFSGRYHFRILVVYSGALSNILILPRTSTMKRLIDVGVR